MRAARHPCMNSELRSDTGQLVRTLSTVFSGVHRKAPLLRVVAHGVPESTFTAWHLYRIRTERLIQYSKIKSHWYLKSLHVEMSGGSWHLMERGHNRRSNDGKLGSAVLLLR